MRTVPALFLGAGGATAASVYGENISDFIREGVRAITHHATRPSWESVGKAREARDGTSALTSEIEALKRMMRESNSEKSVVIVDRGGRTSWSLLTYTAAAATLGYAYLRYVKGWRLADFFYVSQASLKASTSALKQGIDGLKDFTNKTKEYLQGRLDQLETKQGEHMERTERIDGRITVMHEDVDEMRGEIGEVGSNVREVQGTLGEIQDAQQYNSQGIFLLLRVVGELVSGNDFRGIGSRQDLDQFSRQPPPIKNTGAQGLENLSGLGAPGQRALTSGGQGSTAPSLPPPPDITDVTSSSTEGAPGSGRKAPRVLTRGGGGSSGTLVSSMNGTSGFGSRIRT